MRYRGIVLGQARQHDAASITGPLDRQVRDAVNFVRLNTRVAARKDPGRVETPQFSPRAVFEAIVNAVVHRDYSLDNARTRLFVFDDRLELYSPGALPNTLPIEAMRHRQATRNETLASMLRLLAVGDITGSGDRQYFMEQRGEGVPVIYEETHGLTGRDPVYELLAGAELRLTLSARATAGIRHQGRGLGDSRRRPAHRRTDCRTVSQQDLDGAEKPIRSGGFYSSFTRSFRSPSSVRHPGMPRTSSRIGTRPNR